MSARDRRVGKMSIPLQEWNKDEKSEFSAVHVEK